MQLAQFSFLLALGLGAMGMSDAYGPTDRAESVATVHAALDAGVTLVDTGDFYAMGHNELLLAEALRGRDRDSYALSVKFGAQRGPDGAFLGFDARPAAVKTALAYTLRRLGTDHVDLYALHNAEPAEIARDDIQHALEDIRASGKARALAVAGLASPSPSRRWCPGLPCGPSWPGGADRAGSGSWIAVADQRRQTAVGCCRGTGGCGPQSCPTC